MSITKMRDLAAWVKRLDAAIRLYVWLAFACLAVASAGLLFGNRPIYLRFFVGTGFCWLLAILCDRISEYVFRQFCKASLDAMRSYTPNDQ